MSDVEPDDEPTPMENLLEYVVRPLVSNADEVLAIEDEGVLELQVAERDLGRVIGRQGRTIRSLRTLVALAAQRNGVELQLELVE